MRVKLRQEAGVRREARRERENIEGGWFLGPTCCTDSKRGNPQLRSPLL